MNNLERPNAKILRSSESLSEALRANLMGWQVKPTSRNTPIVTCVRPGSIGDIRLIDLTGEPFCAARGRSEIAADSQEFLGILFQRAGSTLCKVGASKTRVGPGDVSVWYSQRPAEFEMPAYFHKLCMLIPVSRFESVLHNPRDYEGLHLPSDNPLAALLGSYLTTLSDEVAAGESSGSTDTVDVTLELLAAAFRAISAKDDHTPRKKLFRRVFQYIESRLGDSDLTPAAVADANDMSLRYLYLLFSEQKTTVAGWIRLRRLARCRAALEDNQNSKTVAEIAYTWGFSDPAHFSRLFKSMYGLSPIGYKKRRREIS